MFLIFKNIVSQCAGAGAAPHHPRLAAPGVSCRGHHADSALTHHTAHGDCTKAWFSSSLSLSISLFLCFSFYFPFSLVIHRHTNTDKHTHTHTHIHTLTHTHAVVTMLTLPSHITRLMEIVQWLDCLVLSLFLSFSFFVFHSISLFHL